MLSSYHYGSDEKIKWFVNHIECLARLDGRDGHRDEDQRRKKGGTRATYVAGKAICNLECVQACIRRHCEVGPIKIPMYFHNEFLIAPGY